MSSAADRVFAEHARSLDPAAIRAAKHEHDGPPRLYTSAASESVALEHRPRLLPFDELAAPHVDPGPSAPNGYAPCWVERRPSAAGARAFAGSTCA